VKQALLASLLVLAVLATPAFGQNIVVTGFETPESVVHDRDADVYLVSNVGAGDPGALDHNGFISRVSPSGTVLQLKWIQDGVNDVVLNGPKGIAIRGDVLYAADIDTLRLFNRETGKPIAAIPIPNPFAPTPLFLNDVAVAEDGTAFISDNANGAIFKVDPRGHASVVSTSPDLGFPNGMLANEPDHPMWVTWLGHQILSMDESGKISVIASLPTVDVSSVGLPPGTLLMDGFVRLPDERGFLVSSWVTGHVYQISPSGKKIKVIASFVSIFDNPNNPDGPADINVDLKRNRLLVPLFDVNELVILDLPSPSDD
jgi:sugar lactone lactonase YvrE